MSLVFHGEVDDRGLLRRDVATEVADQVLSPRCQRSADTRPTIDDAVAENADRPLERIA